MAIRINLMAFALAAIGLISLGPLSKTGLAPTDAKLSEMPHLLKCDAAVSSDRWRPEFRGADQTEYREFECQDGTIDVLAALWRTQSPGKEAVSELNHVVPKELRFVTTSSRAETPLGFHVRELIVRDNENPLVIWTWYAIGNRPVASDLEAKALETFNAALFRREPTAAFAVRASAATVSHARELLSEHIASIWSTYLMSRSKA